MAKTVKKVYDTDLQEFPGLNDITECSDLGCMLLFMVRKDFNLIPTAK